MQKNTFFDPILSDIRSFRAVSNDQRWWATPTPLDSLRYARGEAEESADIDMRFRQPHHNRNNDHDRGALHNEVADTLIMLLSVFAGDQYNTDTIEMHDPAPYIDVAHNDDGVFFDVLSYNIASATLTLYKILNRPAMVTNPLQWIMHWQTALAMIQAYGMVNEVDLGQLVRERLSRIAGKHMPRPNDKVLMDFLAMVWRNNDK